jgi:hypothetical protein
MKKVKILFAAIGIVAIVSGALAFKAAKFSDGAVYCKTTSCNFVNYTPTFISGAATTTTPCGTGVDYYTDPSCPSTGAIAPSATLYATTND